MYSNCLFEAIKAKIKDPKNVKIHLIPPALNKYRFHIYWVNIKENRVYHYSAKNDNFLSRFKLLFNGTLKETPIIFFEECLYNKMKTAGWNLNKQIKIAKKLGFIKTEPFEIDRSDF